MWTSSASPAFFRIKSEPNALFSVSDPRDILAVEDVPPKMEWDRKKQFNSFADQHISNCEPDLRAKTGFSAQFTGMTSLT